MSPKKEVKDIAASVRVRLLNLARQHQIDFNRALLIYFQQCFINRLTRSKYKEKFILKGGLLFYGIEPLVARPTKDIDLLGRKILNQPAVIEATIREIASIKVSDGVNFFSRSIYSETIVARGPYSGVRVFIPAELSKAKQNLQIDVGFGDKIIPGPVQFDYPVLLGNEKIQVYAYSWNSTIAEKFEAIVSFSDLSSRMKDYYDIYYLKKRFNLNGAELTRALAETFGRRNTDITGADYIFSKQFAQNQEMQKQWQAFLHKNGLDERVDFPTVLAQLNRFLKPVISAVVKQESFEKRWDFSAQQWL
jgi:hypothetical protein